MNNFLSCNGNYVKLILNEKFRAKINEKNI